jgi:broad specificity phosphatase PhoE
VILRHSERRDQVDTTYQETDEFKQWPFDTPLTEAGITLAKDVGQELYELHKRAKFSAVVSSPYRRCMQTAAEVVRVLDLPVILDQEVGEVWEEAMPSDRPPHRSPSELQAMAKELGMTIKNPLLPEGGYKLFGKVPQKWPETNKDGHQRCIVRVEHYIEESERTKQNYIIVSHAPAVAAMMDIFQHGFADIDKLQYCARVTATRKINATQVKRELAHNQSVFADQWDVESKGIAHHINLEAEEENFTQIVNDTEEMRRRRLARNTQSDLQECDIVNDMGGQGNAKKNKV